MKYTISAHVQFRLALKYVIKKYWYRKQNVLAVEAGISETMLSYVAKGKKEASLKTQEKIAAVVGYSYENFIALGRMIHQKTPEKDLPGPAIKYNENAQSGQNQQNSIVKQFTDEFDKNGGYHGHTWQELGGDTKMSHSVSMLMKIYDSGDLKLIKLINRILYDFSEGLNNSINNNKKNNR